MKVEKVPKPISVPVKQQAPPEKFEDPGFRARQEEVKTKPPAAKKAPSPSPLNRVNN